MTRRLPRRLPHGLPCSLAHRLPRSLAHRLPRRAWLLLAVLLAVTTGLIFWRTAACKKPVTAGEYRYVIGVSQANIAEPWRGNINDEITRGLENYPDVNVIFSDATQSPQKQEEDIRRMMTYGIDLLIISPQEMQSIRPVLNEVLEKIPVIMLGSDTGERSYTMTIAYNDYQIGQMAGEYIGKELLRDGGNVILIEGMAESEISKKRAQGFSDTIQAYPNIKVVKTMVADWLRDKAEDRMKDYLVLRHDVDVVFALNDEMAYGASIAASKLRFDNIYFFGVDGFDGESGGVSLVRRGILQGTIHCPEIGSLALESAVKVLNGEPVERKLVVNPTLVVRENLPEIKNTQDLA